MATSIVSEQQIVEALHRVPPERWGEVLTILQSLHPAGSTEPEEGQPIRTLGDILHSGMVGMWAERTDIRDRQEYARQLRRQASHRDIQGKRDAAGH